MKKTVIFASAAIAIVSAGLYFGITSTGNDKASTLSSVSVDPALNFSQQTRPAVPDAFHSPADSPKKSKPMTPAIRTKPESMAAETVNTPTSPVKVGLKLRGVITADNNLSDNFFAVIEIIATGTQQLCRIGDHILEGTIIDIYQDGVLLDINGQRHILSIEENACSAQKTETAADDQSFSAPDGRMSGKNFREALNQDVSTDDGNEKQEANQSISIGKTKYGNQPSGVEYTPGTPIPVKLSRINEAFTDLDTLIKEVRVKPVYNETEPEGFILSNIEPTSILKEIGLRIGDIITGINGRKISTVDEALTFYEGLSPGDQVTVQLKRRGRPTTIEYLLEK